MNAEEGLTRIAKLVRWCGTGLGCLFALFGIIALSGTGSDSKFIAITCLIIGTLIFGAGKALGWVIDGFAKRS